MLPIKVHTKLAFNQTHSVMNEDLYCSPSANLAYRRESRLKEFFFNTKAQAGM
jgi:hypothetical protein